MTVTVFYAIYVGRGSSFLVLFSTSRNFGAATVSLSGSGMPHGVSSASIFLLVLPGRRLTTVSKLGLEILPRAS